MITDRIYLCIKYSNDTQVCKLIFNFVVFMYQFFTFCFTIIIKFICIAWNFLFYYFYNKVKNKVEIWKSNFPEKQ